MSVKNSSVTIHQKAIDDIPAFFKQVADLTPDLLYVLNLVDGAVIYINNSVQQLLGQSAADVYDRGNGFFRSVLHPDDYNRHAAHLLACKKLVDHEEKAIDVRLQIAGNHWRWFRIRDKVFKRNSTDHAVQTLGIAQDVHEEKLTIEQLKEEHRRLKTTQAVGHVGSFERVLSDPDKLLQCSEEFYRIHGLPPQSEGIPLKTILATLHPEDQDAYKAALSPAQAIEKPLHLVCRINHPNGHVRHVLLRSDTTSSGAGIPLRVHGTEQDITEQLEAYSRIEHSESLMRQAEVVGNFGSYELQLSNGHFKVSDGFYRLFGHEPGGFTPSLKFIDSVSHPDDIAPVLQVLEQAQTNKKPYVYLRRIYLPNGQMRQLISRGKVFCDEANNAITHIGIVQDVTELHKAEQELRESKELVEQITSTTPDLITIHDAHNNEVVYANHNQLWDESHDSSKVYRLQDDQRARALIHPDYLEQAARFLQERRLLADGEVKEVELQMTGNEQWIRIRSKVFKRDREGKAVQIISFTSDITENKIAEKQLEENAHFIRQVADTTPDVLLVYDLEQMKLQYINRDLFWLPGRQEEAQVTMDTEALFTLVHPADKEAAHAYMHSFADAADKEFKELVLRLQNQLGEWRWYHCRGRTFKRNEAGEVQQYLTIMRDITEERRIQQALLEAEKLSIKGQLARTISHEVRGPLVNVNLALQMLQKEQSKQDNAPLHPYYDIISRSSRRIEEFITELLNLTNEQSVKLVPCLLKEVVEQAVTMAKDRIYLKQIRVEKDYTEGCLVLAKPERLKIAILNLLHNAIEAMEEGQGVLTLEVKKKEKQTILVVQDNGCGMSQVQLAKMFDDYYTSKTSGLGIGLPNVQAILKQHNAGIKVESEPGKGTSFIILFDEVVQ